jgi:iron complex transport system permease protein
MSAENVMVTADAAARRRAGVVAALVALVVVLALVSLGIGPVRLSPLTVIEALFGGGSDVQQVIVNEIRLPRMILGCAIGAILGLAGAALQGLLRNPLASPSLFGAPQSAAFGAVLVISLGLADVRSWALPVAAIVAAFASVFALLAIAGRNAGLLLLILAGLAISSLAGASTALVMNLSSNPFIVLEIAFWLLGSLEDRSFRHVVLALPFIAAGAVILWSQRNAFRALSLGEETAQSLGVDVDRLRLLVITGVALGGGVA